MPYPSAVIHRALLSQPPWLYKRLERGFFFSGAGAGDAPGRAVIGQARPATPTGPAPLPTQPKPATLESATVRVCALFPPSAAFRQDAVEKYALARHRGPPTRV